MSSIFNLEMRFSTTAAIDAIAELLDKPTKYGYQDWSYIYSEPNEIKLYIENYKANSDEDIKFVYFEMIMQALVDQQTKEKLNALWSMVEPLILEDFQLNAFTIKYWSELGEEEFHNCKYLSPLLKRIISTKINSYR